jgi:hypothetical protein
MEFKAKFISSYHYGSVVNVNCPRGLDALDEARKQLGVSFSPELLTDSHIENNNITHVTVNLTEEQARTAGRFAQTDEVVITMMLYYNPLNKYVSVNAVSVRNPDDDAIVEVYWLCTFDYEQLLHDWLEAGAPKEWKIEDCKTK